MGGWPGCSKRFCQAIQATCSSTMACSSASSASAPPRKGPVAVHQNRRDTGRAARAECLGNDIARLALVLALYLLPRHAARAGHLAKKGIGVRGAQRRNAPPALCEHGCPAAVRVHHTANVRESVVQHPVRGRVGRGAQRPLQHLAAVQVYHHHVLRRQVFIRHPAGLNHQRAARPVHAADIAPCQRDKPAAGKAPVGLAHLAFQLVQHFSLHARSFQSSCWRRASSVEPSVI